MKKVIIAITLIIIVSAFLYFKDSIFSDPYIKLGYSEISSEKIKDLDLKKLINKTYYKTLDFALAENSYIDKYKNDYIKINYKNNKDFIKYINELLENNYSSSEINKISEIFTIKYFKEDLLTRYANYILKNSELKKETAIIYVNIGLDQEFYTNIKEIKNPENLLVLTNKYNKLPSNYKPTDLISFDDSYTISSSKRQMRSVAYTAMKSMLDEIRNNNMKIWINSAFRSEELQNSLFTSSVKNNGLSHALKYSAKPGHSEHQTGLAADISSDKGSLSGFENYPAYEWLKENAYKYGFIERYPKDKENITGYAYEPWHYRYVGVDVATIIKNEGITFDEYCAKYLNY